MITKDDFKIGWVHEFTSGSGTKSKYVVTGIRDTSRGDTEIALSDVSGSTDLGWYSMNVTISRGYRSVVAIKKFSLKEATFGMDEYLERMGIRKK